MVKLFEVFVEDIPASDCGVHSRESEAAQRLARKVLSKKAGISSEKIVFERTELGKPFSKNVALNFSWSHSGGKVALAVSENEVGADIQLVVRRRRNVERRVFTGGETALIDAAADENLAFTVLWALKESYLKAIGTGFADNALNIEFSGLLPEPVSNRSEYCFKLQVLDRYVLAVCEKQR